MLKLLYIGASSVCFEMDCQTAYYAATPYSVKLNGKLRGPFDTNVASLFGLKPDADYLLETEQGESIGFHTASESACLSVRDFGARGDGMANDSESIRLALACLPEGGRLLFPAGTYLCEPLFLKSCSTMEFERGAVLLGSPDRAKYPVLPGVLADAENAAEVHFSAFEGIARPMYQSLLQGEYVHDVALVGEGLIDANAGETDFWTNFRTDPVARPRLLFLNRCRNITVHGLSLANSPSWQCHPYFSEDISFFNIKITAPADSPNTDAIDPEACDGVNIIGCELSVGDDCIAIKSGKIELGRKFKQPANRHVIRNCHMMNGHGAITLGSEIGAGVKDLSVSKCLFEGTDRGLRIKTRRGRGKDSRVEEVCFENIEMRRVKTPITMNMYYNCCDPDRDSEYVWSREKLPVDERTPYLGRFCFRKIQCTDAEVAACFCDGLPEQPIESVCLENVSISFAENAKPGKPVMQAGIQPMARTGMVFRHVRKLTLSHVNIQGQIGEELVTEDVGMISRGDYVSAD